MYTTLPLIFSYPHILRSSYSHIHHFKSSSTQLHVQYLEIPTPRHLVTSAQPRLNNRFHSHVHADYTPLRSVTLRTGWAWLGMSVHFPSVPSIAPSLPPSSPLSNFFQCLGVVNISPSPSLSFSFFLSTSPRLPGLLEWAPWHREGPEAEAFSVAWRSAARRGVYDIPSRHQLSHPATPGDASWKFQRRGMERCSSRRIFMVLLLCIYKTAFSAHHLKKADAEKRQLEPAYRYPISTCVHTQVHARRPRPESYRPSSPHLSSQIHIRHTIS